MYSQEENRKLMPPSKKRRKYTNEPSNIDELLIDNNSHDETSHQDSSNIFCLNIMDRVLDLNKYNEKTTLYSLCRDWINATASIADSRNKFENKKNEISDQEEIANYTINYFRNRNKSSLY